jgi:hypothetical protein
MVKTPRDWAPEFIEAMARRMEVSFHKYGPVELAYPKRIDALGNVAARIEKYRATHNTEWLVDAANFLMIEFMLPRYSDASFRGTDAEESPGRVNRGGAVTHAPNERLGKAEVQ